MTIAKKAATAGKEPRNGKPGDITVTVTPTSGAPSLKYCPEEFVLKKGNGKKVRLVLDDPQKIGYQFTGFHWLPVELPAHYCEKIQVDPSGIELTINNKCTKVTDYGYEVFVAKGAEAVSLKATSTVARKAALLPDVVAGKLNELGVRSQAVTDGIFLLAAQLRSGPIIRNDPG